MLPTQQHGAGAWVGGGGAPLQQQYGNNPCVAAQMTSAAAVPAGVVPAVPTVHDVLIGRSPLIHQHPGNQRYLQLLANYKAQQGRGANPVANEDQYAQFIVNSLTITTNLIGTPMITGRFLQQNEQTGQWTEIPRALALEKVKINLRECNGGSSNTTTTNNNTSATSTTNNNINQGNNEQTTTTKVVPANQDVLIITQDSGRLALLRDSNGKNKKLDPYRSLLLSHKKLIQQEQMRSHEHQMQPPLEEEQIATSAKKIVAETKGRFLLRGNENGGDSPWQALPQTRALKQTQVFLRECLAAKTDDWETETILNQNSDINSDVEDDSEHDDKGKKESHNAQHPPAAATPMTTTKPAPGQSARPQQRQNRTKAGLTAMDWMDRYTQLEEYYEANGHSSVPLNYPGLGEWVLKQRQEYFRRQQGVPNQLMDEHVALLQQVDFSFDGAARPKAKRDVDWMKNYELLKAYIRDHQVSQVAASQVLSRTNDNKLANFVQYHQAVMRKLQEDPNAKPSRDILPQRIALLKKLNVEWGIRQNKQQDLDSVWMEHYNELSRIYEKYGRHLQPAQIRKYEQNDKLAEFVNDCRQHYAAILRGQKSAILTQERIDLLNKIDFAWRVRVSPKDYWMTRYNELVEYKKAHGDCLVPSHYPPNTALATFVRTQRKQYAAYMKAKENGDEPTQEEGAKKSTSSMTEERIEMLNKLDFEFVLPEVYDGRTFARAFPVQEQDASLGRQNELLKAATIDQAGGSKVPRQQQPPMVDSDSDETDDDEQEEHNAAVDEDGVYYEQDEDGWKRVEKLEKTLRSLEKTEADLKAAETLVRNLQQKLEKKRKRADKLMERNKRKEDALMNGLTEWEQQMVKQSHAIQLKEYREWKQLQERQAKAAKK